MGPSIERQLSIGAWCVLTLHRGLLTWIGRGITLEARPGEATVLGPGMHAVVRGRAPGELIGHYFCFQAEEVGSVFGTPMRLLFEKAARDSDPAWILPSRSPVTRKLRALTLDRSRAGTPEQRCQILAIFPPLIRELQSDCHGKKDGTDGAKARILATVTQLTDAEIRSASVEDLAQKCNCSRRHFTRLIQEHFGCSAVELKVQVRLDRAAALLKNPKAKVLNVALDCGFNHLGQFAARFRERFDMTPTQWRAKAADSRHNPEALEDERAGGDASFAALRFDPEKAVPTGIAATGSPAQDFLSCL